MIRTQVYLDDQVYSYIQLQAKAQNMPAAVLIRKYLVSGIKKNPKKQTAREALLALARAAAQYRGPKGPTDLALNHDYYLYGGKRRDH